MPCGLPDDLADLDLRLDVREIGDVAQELLAVLAHPLLEVGERIEVDVPDRHVRRRSAWRTTAEAFVHLGAHQPEAAQALAHELHVPVDVVIVVELLVFACRVEHGNADHDNLLARRMDRPAELTVCGRAARVKTRNSPPGRDSPYFAPRACVSISISTVRLSSAVRTSRANAMRTPCSRSPLRSRNLNPSRSTATIVASSAGSPAKWRA